MQPIHTWLSVSIHQNINGIHYNVKNNKKFHCLLEKNNLKNRAIVAQDLNFALKL